MSKVNGSDAAFSDRVSVVEIEDGLFLRFESANSVSLFRPDFSSDRMRRRVEDERRRRGLLLKAIEGRSSSVRLKIFDFCSGFGGDAFLLACLGHSVISCEKNPLIAQVTQRAWEDQRFEPWVVDLGVDLKFMEGDSREYLQESEDRFDVIYMDPMFEKLKSTAKSPLPMQIAQVLVSGEAGSDGMSSSGIDSHLESASSFEKDFLAAAQVSSKIVVKLPLKGKALVSRPPSHQLFGKTVRFEVFVQS